MYASAGHNRNPFHDVPIEKRRVMDGDRAPRGPPPESEPAGFALPPFAEHQDETYGVVQIVKFTLDREGEVAGVIHRLSYQVDCTCELAQRARSYALELQHYIARLRALLPPSAGASEGRSLESKHRSAIEGLGPDDAKLVLIRFLLRHAATPSEILASAGDQPKARILEMLRRRTERERHKIALWINEHEAGLHEKSGRRARTSGFSRRASETVQPAPHDGIFGRLGPLGDSASARPTVRWKEAPEMSG